MATTPTSQFSSARLAGLSDELLKIATEISRKERVKKFLKNTALVAGGAGAGTGTAMLAHLAAKKMFPRWGKLSPETRLKILGPLIGAGTLAGGLLAHKLDEERNK